MKPRVIDRKGAACVVAVLLAFEGHGTPATFTKGSDGVAAHQYRNPCKVSVTADPALVIRKVLYIEPRSYIFSTSALPAAGWKPASAKYKNASDQIVSLIAPIANPWRFTIPHTFGASGGNTIVTVEFETLRRTPNGSPDYRDAIQIDAVIVPDLATLDSDGNGFADAWELRYFGEVGRAAPSADLDGDGLTNLEEFRGGTNPLDFWNGSPPILSIIGDSDRGDFPNSILNPPLVVRVTNALGIPKAGMTINFAIMEGGGSLRTIQSVTDSTGRAWATVVLPALVGNTVFVRARLSHAGNDLDQFFAVTVGDETLPPEPPSKPTVEMAPGETQATITWDDLSDNETAFYVERTVDYVTWIRRATLPKNTTQYVDTGLNADTLYIYRIVAHNEAP